VEAYLLFFFNLGDRWDWYLTLSPVRLTPGNKPVPIVQETGWDTGPVWTGAENLVHTGIRSPTVQLVTGLPENV
jgi:hypothetical protein